MHAAGWQVGGRAACGLAIVASLLFWLCLAANSAHAGSLQHCTQPPALSAAQHDRLLRVSAVIREELELSGTRTALVARSGLNLRWFDMRYSHAGLSLRGSGESRWAVRQLYFSCDEQQPRLFDQGLSAFVLGTEDPSLGYVSVVIFDRVADGSEGGGPGGLGVRRRPARPPARAAEPPSQPGGERRAGAGGLSQVPVRARGVRAIVVSGAGILQARRVPGGWRGCQR